MPPPGGIWRFRGITSPKNEDARDRSLWRPNAANSQVTRTMHRPVSLMMSPQVALTSASSGLPAIELRVASLLHPSALLACKSSGCPVNPLPVSPTMSPQVALTSASSACQVQASGFPRILSPGGASERISEFPRISYPPALPSMRLRVSPAPASTAGR